MLIVLNNPTAGLVSEALKEASEATMSTQRLREVEIYLAVLPIYPCVQRPLLELSQAAKFTNRDNITLIFFNFRTNILLTC